MFNTSMCLYVDFILFIKKKFVLKLNINSCDFD